MTQFANLPTPRSTPLPDDMHILHAAYPREAWEAHPGFAEKTRHWLGAHQMFRDLAGFVQEQSQEVLDRRLSMDSFAALLSRYGGALLRNLHGHHTWEDRSYFPELMAADPRFAAGLEVLEQDHHDLDLVLDAFGRSANRAVQLAQLDPAQAYDEAGTVLAHAGHIAGFLDRHLTDEEDLAVPIILHHRLRG